MKAADQLMVCLILSWGSG